MSSTSLELDFAIAEDEGDEEQEQVFIAEIAWKSLLFLSNSSLLLSTNRLAISVSLPSWHPASGHVRSTLLVWAFPRIQVSVRRYIIAPSGELILSTFTFSLLIILRM